jgi:short-chain Z-isoprenyl diphosphate synthase
MTLRAIARTWLEDIYVAYLERKLRPLPKPKHVAIILDGNRRWAAERGLSASRGHRSGGEKIEEVLQWCDESAVEIVTLWLLSTDNLGRADSELIPLYATIERTAEQLARQSNWRINLVGAPEMLPAPTRDALLAAVEATKSHTGMVVNMAVAYGGRREVVDAVRALLQEHEQLGTPLAELAEQLTADHIAAHLYTRGQPDPDLVIRTSGEQRLGGFLLWQSAKSEFWFCDAYWPDFRKVDLLRALRDYSKRQRRFGQ